MILDNNSNDFLFSNPTCIRCGAVLLTTDDDIAHTCQNCKCVK